MKTLRYDLKAWSKGVSRLSILIQNCNQALAEIDGLEDQRPLTTPERNFRRIIKAHLLKLLDYQNQYWRKRCTIRYIKFGEENTKLFQSLATERYRRNSIAILKKPDGTAVQDHKAKEEILFQVFKQRLGESSPPTMKFNLSEIIKKIDGLEALSAPFTHREIDEVSRIDRARAAVWLSADWVVHDSIMPPLSQMSPNPSFYKGSHIIRGVKQ